MKNKNGFLELLYGWIGAPLVIGYWVLGTFSYIWSIIIALKEWGLGGAFITFCLPVLGQLFWTYKMLKIHSFTNNFVLVSVGAFLCYIFSLIFIHLSAKYAQDNQKDYSI